MFDAAEEGQMPLGEHTGEFVYGDVEAALKSADLVLDETFLGSSTGHQPLEPRSAMAYWQNGKLYMHAGTQSTVQTVGSVATSVGIKPEDVVLISEYTGGGFGSKIPGAIFYAIPALLSKKANAPVLMRITREEEHYVGRARPGLTSRVKVGFRKDGKIVVIDGFAIQENGPYNQQGDVNSAGQTISLCYQPEAMRWRTVTVLTNTPPKTSQRAPGGMQGNGLMEPVITKAANKLGIDQVEIRRINAPEGRAPFGAAGANGQRQRVTDSHLKDALTKGAELFGWEEKKARSGRRVGTKVRGSGVAVSSYTAGSIGFDGLLVFRPDGKIQVQSGIGNLGTHSMFDVHRVAAEILDTPWEQFEVVYGDTGKHLPWSCISAGSQTAHAMTRAAHAVATAAKARLQEVAAKTYGGSPASYPVSNGRVGRMSFADAAKKAIELGGTYDGHEVAGRQQHQRVHEALRRWSGRPGTRRRGTRQLPAQRREPVVRRRLRGSGSRRRDRCLRHPRVRGGCRLRHRAQPAEPQGPDLRRPDARHRPRDRSEVGLRPALRGAAREAVPLQQAADDSRRAE